MCMANIHQTPAAIFWLFVVQMEQGQRPKEHILQQACQRDPSASMQLQTVSSTFFNIDLTPQLLQPNHAKSALIPANNKAPIRRMSPKRYGPAVASDSVLGARASFSISVLLRHTQTMSLVCFSLRDLDEVCLAVGLICWSGACGRLQPLSALASLRLKLALFFLVRSAAPVLPFVGIG